MIHLLLLAGAILFAFFGLFGLYGVVRNVMLARSSRSGERTDGVVESVEFTKQKSLRRTPGEPETNWWVYIPVVRYAYTIRGERFTSQNRFFGTYATLMSHEGKEDFKNECFVNKPVDVYYNPRRPTQAVSEHGTEHISTRGVVVAVILCFMISVIGIGIVASTLN